MQRTATTFGLGLAGAITLGLSLAPSSFADDGGEPNTVTPINETPVEKIVEKPTAFLDLMYAAPHEDLHLGDTTTVVIAQTLPAAYTLTSTMANGNKCFYPYEAPAAQTTKSGTEADADLIERTIVSSGLDTNSNGIDDHYEGAYDDAGIAACKIKATDEFGNVDWKYIYIKLDLPKPSKTPVGEDFDANATTTVVDPPATSTAPIVAAAAPESSEVAGVEVAGATVTAEATLPRTGTGTWIAALVGGGLAALGAAMVLITRRRHPADDRHTFVI